MPAVQAGLRSMTGFGAARGQLDSTALEVEVRAVNHRHLKVQVRAPEVLSALAPRCEEKVRARLSRGSVALTLRLGARLARQRPVLDREALSHLYRELVDAAQELQTPPPSLAEVAQLPGVVRLAEPGDDDVEAAWPHLAQVLDEALDALDAMRQEEGRGIAQDLQQLAASITGHAAQIQERLPEALAEQHTRLQARVQQLLGESPLEPAELAREVALVADKSDISEELQRLRSHLQQLLATIGGEAGAARPSTPVGRKLEFLAQELLREANTMASKSHDSALVQTILEIKLDVERIREQVLNVA